jgi:hypothetical protein
LHRQTKKTAISCNFKLLFASKGQKNKTENDEEPRRTICPAGAGTQEYHLYGMLHVLPRPRRGE